MARGLIALGSAALLWLLSSQALAAVTPGEYLYATAQTSNFTITNPAGSIDGALNGSAASITGAFPRQAGNNWTFTVLQDTTAAAVQGVLVEVRFGVTGWADDSFTLDLFDGTTWTTIATYGLAPGVAPPSTLATLGFDVSAVLNTVAKVNAAQVRFAGSAMVPGPDNITLAVDGVRLGVEAAPTATPTVSPSPSPTASPSSTATSTATATPTATGTPPTATPTATATPPTATPTATATPSASPTATPTATATTTPAPTATATPTPEPTPSGETAISPDNAATAEAGATVSYTHTVTHLGNAWDVKNVTVSSSQGWTVSLFAADGVTPLADSNGDGIPDTDRLNSGQSTNIVVRVAVPAGATGNTQDVVTVTAGSTRRPLPANSDTARDTTTVRAVLTLSLSTTSVDFGRVSPGGDPDPSVPAIAVAADDAGASYAKSSAVQITVTSNVPWIGSCQAAENSGDAAGIQIAQGDLEWQPSGGGIWTSFYLPGQGPPQETNPFPSRVQGTNVYQFSYRLRVDWTDDPGAFDSVVTYSVSP